MNGHVLLLMSRFYERGLTFCGGGLIAQLIGRVTCCKAVSRSCVLPVRSELTDDLSLSSEITSTCSTHVPFQKVTSLCCNYRYRKTNVH